MTTQKVIDRLRDLIKDRESFICMDDPEDVFALDRAALIRACDLLDERKEMLQAIRDGVENSSIAPCFTCADWDRELDDESAGCYGCTCCDKWQCRWKGEE